MDTVRKITHELAIAGQPTLNELKQLVQEGYQTVVNLRSPSELGFLSDEQPEAECLGLCYVNIPVRLDGLNLEHVLQVIQQLIELPKPMLVHCNSGIRSSIVVLIQIAIKQGMKAEDAFQKAAALGLLNNRF